MIGRYFVELGSLPTLLGHVEVLALFIMGMDRVHWVGGWRDLLPGHVEGLILLLIQLLDGLQDLGFVVLHNPLLLHQVVVLKEGEVDGDEGNLLFQSRLDV